MGKYISLACLLISLAACNQAPSPPANSNGDTSSASAPSATDNSQTSQVANADLPTVAEYPDMVQIPNSPVYYAPQVNSNYFFYDGSYWVYQGNNWYTSSWYNGPWEAVDPEGVPSYILLIPVGYYRQPPPYFQGWSSNAPPRWDEHYGNAWAQRHSGWNQRNLGAVPRAAPLPVYQKQYSGAHYPGTHQQAALQSQHSSYRPAPSAASRAATENRAALVESGTRRESERTPTTGAHAPAPSSPRAPLVPQDRTPRSQATHSERPPEQITHRTPSTGPRPAAAPGPRVQRTPPPALRATVAPRPPKAPPKAAAAPKPKPGEPADKKGPEK